MVAEELKKKYLNKLATSAKWAQRAIEHANLR